VKHNTVRRLRVKNAKTSPFLRDRAVYRVQVLQQHYNKHAG